MRNVVDDCEATELFQFEPLNGTKEPFHVPLVPFQEENVGAVRIRIYRQN